MSFLVCKFLTNKNGKNNKNKKYIYKAYIPGVWRIKSLSIYIIIQILTWYIYGRIGEGGGVGSLYVLCLECMQSAVMGAA